MISKVKETAKKPLDYTGRVIGLGSAEEQTESTRTAVWWLFVVSLIAFGVMVGGMLGLLIMLTVAFLMMGTLRKRFSMIDRVWEIITLKGVIR